MSKRLKEVFAKMSHVSLLQTLETQPCDLNGTMDIIVEEQHVDGSAWQHGVTRYVKVCHSQDVCKHYEIETDPTTGIGRATITGIQAVQHVVVQVDDCGSQMINGDDYEVQYIVNEEVSQDDYATMYYTSDPASSHQCLRIVNREVAKTEIELYKILRDRNQNPIPFQRDMCFHIRLVDECGCETFVDLDYEHNFHALLCGLRSGYYCIEECGETPYNVSYRLNFGEETLDTSFDLTQGHNELQIINEELMDTTLVIEKYIRSGNGELCKPQRFDQFQVRVISNTQDQILDLHDGNNFCVTLYGLEPGYYDVFEVNEDCDVPFDISYIVNDKAECGYAHLEINECECAKVIVVNTMDSFACNANQDSPLRICKFIRGSDGCLVKPCEQDSFKVMVTGCGMCETFNLNANNNFCVDLANICSGDYEIKEVSCGDYTTSYIVNDGMERTTACIRVCDDRMFCVSIINQERNRGNLSVSKYIRNEHGELVKPDRKQSFDISLSSYFCKKCFVLNAENDFCMSFQDLRLGSYEIKEETSCDYEVGYIVNCNKERRHARIIIDDHCENEVKIINSTRKQNCGILKICKYEETNMHELVKPCGDEEFEVSVCGPCFEQVYVLRASNNWCVLLEGLLPGEYRIHEINCEDFEVCYQVNREYMEEACVYLGEYNQEVCVINRRKQSGKVKLVSSIRDCDGCIRRPSSNYEFIILLEGSEHSYQTCLNAQNQWCVLLDQLPEDIYRVIQKDNLGFKVSYCINGAEECFAKFALGREDVEVNIINEVSDCNGMVKITKYMEGEQGVLLMPCPQDEFHIEVKGRGFANTYRLHEGNDFCIYFDDLEEGNYEIKELDCMHEVTYRINGVCKEQGNFGLGRDDVYIDVINTPIKKGLVSIEKRIRRGNRLVMPNEQDCFQVLVKGRNCHEVYDLTCENDFHICLRDLNHQHYEVKELGRNAKAYDINGCEQCDGYFLYNGEGVQITIINEEEKQGSIEISKMMEDVDGCLVKPSRYDCFEVIIESENFKQKIILDKENNFCERLYNLPADHYEIKELTNDYCVSYQINGMPCTKACVDVCEDDTCITIINSEYRKGSIQFQAWVEENGCRRNPMCKDEFKLVICNDGESESIVLCEKNDFCEKLYDLKPNAYTITESGCEPIFFEIDGHVFEDVVCIELNGEDVCVDVVRKCGCKPTITIQKFMEDCDGRRSTPGRKDCFEVVLHHKGRKQMFELNHKNNWTQVMEDQEPGTYEVKEVSSTCDVRYQIDDACITTQGVFELEKEDVMVRVLNRVRPKNTLVLDAKVRDCDGTLVCPQGDDAFCVDVDSHNVSKSFLLNKKNNWCENMEVEPGMYTICQQQNSDFKEQYYIVDERKEYQASVHVECEDVHVTCVNVKKSYGGTLELIKYKRDNSCGCMHRPSGNEEYEVEVQGDHFHEIVTLNMGNKWREKLDCLACGEYRVREIGGQNKVSYIVNGDKETTNAIVYIEEDMSYVKIINEQDETSGGSIELCKLIRDGEGCYRYPGEKDSFWVKIKGEDSTNRVLLNFANHFYASMRNLKDGWYEVIEESEAQGITYVVNNAAPSVRGLVHVMGNANTVNVINPEDCCGASIQLCKYIQTNEGLLVKPNNCMSYRIHVSKPGYNQVITLNADNEYCVMLQDLDDGLYVIDELDHEDVTYIVNGGSQVTNAVVDVRGNANQVQIINPQGTSGKGSISLAKYLRVNNKLVRPSGSDSFVFHVSKPNYNKLFTLDASNHWMQTLTDLEDGDYVINETTTGDKVTYIINGGSESDQGVVKVNGNSNSVQIINAKEELSGSIQLDKFVRTGQQLVRPNPAFTTRIHVSKPGYNEVFTLNKENNWSYLIENLERGEYVVDEVDSKDSVTYIINGGSEVANGVVRVDNDTNTVQIINTPMVEEGSIRIEKFIRDANNKLVRPQMGYEASVHVSSSGYNEYFVLNASNAWTINLQNLKDGLYVIDEINSTDSVSYIINGGSETINGVVRVSKNANQVQMINTPSSMGGSIRIEKFIRDANNKLVRPPMGFEAQVQVSSSGYNEYVTLDANNAWTINLQNLKDGLYVIDEINSTDSVSYIINGGSETINGVVRVSKNANQVQMINTPSSTGGSIRIEKFIRDANNELVRPPMGFEAQVQVSSSGYNEYFVLNASNAWTMNLQNLNDGLYVIDEIDSSDSVTYIINGGSETRNGVVRVNKDSNQVQMINAQSSTGGSIRIEKFIRDANNELVRPSMGFEAQVQVSSSGYNEYFVLNASNAWTMNLQNLKDGLYVIDEIDSSDSVTYIINGGSETRNGVVRVNKNANQVQMINEQTTSGGSIAIQKFIRNESGALVQPSDIESFQVTVRGTGNYQKVFTLNSANRWATNITGLPMGSYQILEMDTTKYQVSYIVDNGAEGAYALVNVNNEAHRVQIINSPSTVLGNLTITKLIKNADGTLIRPVDGDVFMLEVYNDDVLRNVQLNNENQFTALVGNLPNGDYFIREIDEDDNYVTTFRINGGNITDNAVVTMKPNTTNTVEVINEIRANTNTLDVYKYMLDEAGNYVPPRNDEAFQFEITGENFSQVYDANAANEWHVIITNLPTGNFELKEVGASPYRVQYLVNSPTLTDTANFTTTPGGSLIIGIINLLENVENGRMTLTKRIRDRSGNLIVPNNGETFNIRVLSPKFDQLVALDPNNNYVDMLQNLPYGTYTLEEVDAKYDVSFQINGGSEQSVGQLMISSGAPNAVVVINTESTPVVHNNGMLSFIL